MVGPVAVRPSASALRWTPQRAVADSLVLATDVLVLHAAGGVGRVAGVRDTLRLSAAAASLPALLAALERFRGSVARLPPAPPPPVAVGAGAAPVGDPPLLALVAPRLLAPVTLAAPSARPPSSAPPASAAPSLGGRATLAARLVGSVDSLDGRARVHLVDLRAAGVAARDVDAELVGSGPPARPRGTVRVDATDVATAAGRWRALTVGADLAVADGARVVGRLAATPGAPLPTPADGAAPLPPAPAVRLAGAARLAPGGAVDATVDALVVQPAPLADDPTPLVRLERPARLRVDSVPAGVVAALAGAPLDPDDPAQAALATRLLAVGARARGTRAAPAVEALATLRPSPDAAARRDRAFAARSAAPAGGRAGRRRAARPPVEGLDALLGDAGTLDARRGTDTLVAGPIRRVFDIEQGSIRFTGAPGLDPALDISALYTFRVASGDAVRARARVLGTLERPRLELSSAYGTMSEEQVLSSLVTGQATFDPTSADAYRRLAGAEVASRLASSVADRVAGGFFDVVRVTPGSAGAGGSDLRGMGQSALSSSRLGLGKQLGPRLFLQLDAGTCGLRARGGTGLAFAPAAFSDALGLALDWRVRTDGGVRLSSAPSSAQVTCQGSEQQRGAGTPPRQWALDLFRTWRF